MTVSKASQVVIEEHVHFTKSEGNMVLLNYETGTYFGLDPVGAQFWKLCAEHKSISEVLSSLLEEYEVAEEVLWKDLQNLLLHWLDKGLIKVVDPNG